jgi:hypothetical protein
MGLKLEFFSVIIPVENLRRVLAPEEVEEMLARPLMNCWHDGELYRDGAMNPLDVDDMVRDWESRGLEPFTRTEDGQKAWKDLCVVDYRDGPTFPCAWLEFDAGHHLVWREGRPPGPSVGPPDREIYEGEKLTW